MWKLQKCHILTFNAEKNNMKVEQASILPSTIVYKHLRDHEKPGVQKLAQKMSEEVPRIRKTEET